MVPNNNLPTFLYPFFFFRIIVSDTNIFKECNNNNNNFHDYFLNFNKTERMKTNFALNKNNNIFLNNFEVLSFFFYI